jgi:hypothetical protein
MSRFNFAIALSLVASLSSAAVADAPMKFAQPPSTSVSNHDDARADLYAAPVRLDRAAIRAKLAQNRAANLARFRVYQNKGVFPNNTYTDGKLNVWLDELGNLCAAATIMKLSGEDDLVQRTADQNNFIRLADVTQGPLMNWILTSGLTQDEIVAIQEPMVRVTPNPMMEPGPEPIIVDARMRRIEDRRLNAKYKQVDAQIVKAKNKSLDAATDRLLANPDLAASFLAS